MGVQIVIAEFFIIEARDLFHDGQRNAHGHGYDAFGTGQEISRFMPLGGALKAVNRRYPDEIGAILGARMIVMLIGERPGLSASDSLGAYLTVAPKIGRTDAERICVSNIHGAGLGYDEAAFRIAWLVREGLARGVTGVGLKDESGESTPRPIAAN